MEISEKSHYLPKTQPKIVSRTIFVTESTNVTYIYEHVKLSKTMEISEKSNSHYIIQQPKTQRRMRKRGENKCEMNRNTFITMSSTTTTTTTLDSTSYTNTTFFSC